MENESVYSQRVDALRRLMSSNGIDVYLIVTDDYHASEYVGSYFKCREYISGFSGSAGNLVITQDFAGLWTDGRYFLQAADQLAGSGIELMKMNEPGVPTIPQFIADTLKDGSVLGFDGKTVSFGYAESIKRIVKGKNIRYVIDKDLAGEVWTDRPKMSAEPVWLLSDKYTGVTRAQKLAEVRRKMAENGADALLMATLDDVNYLYNIRGNDVAYTPLALSYTVVTPDSAVLYASAEAVSDEVRQALAGDGVELKPYFDVYADIAGLPAGTSLWLERAKVNIALVSSVPEGVKQLDLTNPTALMKAVKTPTEAENERYAHLLDGVAVTKLIYWLKKMHSSEEFKNHEITELTVAAKLEELRKQGEGYIEQSFAPIIATGAHGAIVHYDPTEETDIPIEDNTFLLMDTGGQYLYGTTDITRTIAMGTVSEEQKRLYTAVLRGNLELGMAKFKYGVNGTNLDYLARSPLWELGLDYNHGTGHGVGYLSVVHERPNGIRLKQFPGASPVPMEENMITSNEPGVYLEGKYGIRIENLIICVEENKTEFGRFMGFDTLTLVPHDRDSILPEMLTENELSFLNSYHQNVYEKLSPFLSPEEREWLRQYTAPITK